MKNYINIFCISIAIIATSLLQYSCTSAKSTNLLQQNGPIYAPSPLKDYKLKYNDEIYCNILTSNKDFSDVFNGVLSNTLDNNSDIAYTIYETGNISIPFFGDIDIVDLTIPEAESVIQTKMRQAIPDAQVRLNLVNSYFYVVSEGQNGRFLVYKDNMTIYQALANIGEPNSSIDYGNIKIIRTDKNGKATIKKFDLRSESLIESEFYYLKPNDLLYYSTSKRAFFQISSFSSVISAIVAPISVVAAILAMTVKK